MALDFDRVCLPVSARSLRQPIDRRVRAAPPRSGRRRQAPRRPARPRALRSPHLALHFEWCGDRVAARAAQHPRRDGLVGDPPGDPRVPQPALRQPRRSTPRRLPGLLPPRPVPQLVRVVFPGLLFRIDGPSGHHWFKRVLEWNAQLPLPEKHGPKLVPLAPYSRFARFILASRPVLVKLCEQHQLPLSAEALFVCSILHAVDHASCDKHTRGHLLENEATPNAGLYNVIALLFYRPAQHFWTNLLRDKRRKRALRRAVSRAVAPRSGARRPGDAVHHVLRAMSSSRRRRRLTERRETACSRRSVVRH